MMGKTTDGKQRGRQSLAKRAEPANCRWDTSGMNSVQVEEANALLARVNGRQSRPRLKFETRHGQEDEPVHRALVVGEGSDAAKTLHSMRFFDVAGSQSHDFGQELLWRLTGILKLSGDDERDSERVTAALALIGGIAPQNELEATMALQMVAANEATLNSFNNARLNACNPEFASAFSNMANKAMRSFALHAEAITKMRRNGEQVVKHVHVNDGGQAVIAGTVNTGRGA